MKFVMFDIKDLLNKVPNFANEYINILKCDIDIIHHATKSLLFDRSHAWIKKQGGLFDVAVGAYDGTDVCELMGAYMLSLLSKTYNKNN